MKKIYCFLLLFFSLSAASAQLQELETAGWSTIGHLKRIGTTIAKLEYKVSGRDTLYNLLMKDFTRQQETNYFSLGFKSTDNSFGRLYDILTSFFSGENRHNKKYMRTFRLGNDNVNLQHTVVIGSKAVRLTTTGGYINLSEKDINKLFGMR